MFTRERAEERWLANSMELTGGWASELVWINDELWIAWASCDDPESEMVLPQTGSKTNDTRWTLKKEYSLSQWRDISSEIMFSVSLGKITDGGIKNIQQISAGTCSTGGFAIVSIPNQSKPVVLWEERRSHGSVILVNMGDGRNETISDSPGAKLGLRASSDSDGNIRAIWQQWDGQIEGEYIPPRIATSTKNFFTNKAWSKEGFISSNKYSAWSPAITHDDSGGTWCAWDAWDGITYQIFARYAAKEGTFGKPIQVTETTFVPYLNFGVDIVAKSSKAWVVWSRTTEWGTINHRLNHMKTLHAKTLQLDDQGELVANFPNAKVVQGQPGQLPVVPIPFIFLQEPEFINPQTPRVYLDADENPVVFYRQHRRMIGDRDWGWSVCSIRNNGNDWTAPFRLTEHYGFPDTRYSLAPTAHNETWIIAAHAAEPPTNQNGHNPIKNHRLIIEELHVGYGSDNEQPGVHATFSKPSVPQGIPNIPDKMNKDALRHNHLKNTSGGNTYDLLYGDLHRHTAYSKCMSSVDGDPLDQYRWAHDVEELDFYAITEHLEFMSYLEWRLVDDLTERLSDNRKVIVLHGFELIPHPGHINFFYSDASIQHDLRVAVLSARTHGLEEVWKNVEACIPPEKLLGIRHYHTFEGYRHEGENLINTYNPAYEQVVEIIQTRGEASDWVKSLWAKGFKVGVVGSSDHSRNAPFLKAMTGLWVPEEKNRNGDSILNGLRSRRTFATNGVKMSVFLSATASDNSNTLLMGEEGSIKGDIHLKAELSGTTKLQTVEFYRNYEIIHAISLETESVLVDYIDDQSPEGENIYWIRVTQHPEDLGNRPSWGIAYSSPIWVNSP